MLMGKTFLSNYPQVADTKNIDFQDFFEKSGKTQINNIFYQNHACRAWGRRRQGVGTIWRPSHCSLGWLSHSPLYSFRQDVTLGYRDFRWEDELRLERGIFFISCHGMEHPHTQSQVPRPSEPRSSRASIITSSLIYQYVSEDRLEPTSVCDPPFRKAPAAR